MLGSQRAPNFQHLTWSHNVHPHSHTGHASKASGKVEGLASMKPREAALRPAKAGREKLRLR